MKKHKKIKILAVCLCICLVAGAVLNQIGILKVTTAAEDIWDGTIPPISAATYTYGGGAGTAASPYQISTGAHLAQMCVNINGGLYGTTVKYFSLVNDINLNGNPWTAIGKGNNQFYGVFNGNGNKIRNVSITGSSADQGLFGYASKATISNLHVTGEISGGSSVGGIVGFCSGSTLTNCSFTGTVTGASRVGAIVGSGIVDTNASVLNGCSALASTVITATNGPVGGLAGSMTGGSIVVNGYNRGKVTLNTSNASDTAAHASGLVGYMSNGTVVNSYNLGEVKSNQWASGLSAGINAKVKNCYNIGTVTSTTVGKAGVISGFLTTSSTVENCYYLDTSTPLELTNVISNGTGGITSIKNIGYFTADSTFTYNLTKAAFLSDDNWKMGGKALLNALADFVTSEINTYTTMREWGKDDEFANAGYPFLTTTVGHVHTYTGGSSRVEKAATCTEKGVRFIKCNLCSYEKEEEILALGHDTKTVLALETCTTDGSETDVCQRTGCGVTTDTRVRQAIGHHYAEFTQAATCTEEGYTVYRCDNTGCSVENGSKIPIAAKGHTNVRTVIDATCTMNEILVDTCSVCDNVNRQERANSALNHAWDYVDGIYLAATCQEIGGMVRTCNRCSEAEFVGDTVPITAHNWSYSKKTEPTCTEVGHTVYECTVCKTAKTEDYVNAKGHVFKSQVVPPTCMTTGYTEHTCLSCTYSYQDAPTTTTAHQYIVDSIEPPTCLADGIRTNKCTTCLGLSFDVLPSLGGHNFVVNSEKSKLQTCTEGGYTVYSCTACDTDETRDIVNEGFGHEYETEVIAPTCLDDGYTLHTCSRCDNSYHTAATTALGHSYLSNKVEATTTTRGYTEHECQGCADSYISDYIAATPSGTYDAPTSLLTLSDMDEKMLYSLDGGKNWIETEEAAVTLDEEDVKPEDGIWIKRPGNDVIPVADSAVQVVVITKPAVPDAIDAIEPDTKDGTGSIRGVDETMEYRKEGDTEWQDVIGDVIKNLPPGIYYVRIKANGSAMSSEAKKIVIQEYVEPTATPTTTPTTAPTTTPTATPTPGTTSTPTPGTTSTPKPGTTSTPVPGATSTPGDGIGNGDNSGGGNNTGNNANTNNSDGSGNNTNTGNSDGSGNSTNTGNSDGSGNNSTNTNNGGNGVLNNDVYYSGASNTSKTGSNASAKTGDTADVVVWILVAISAIGIFTFSVKKTKNRLNSGRGR